MMSCHPGPSMRCRVADVVPGPEFRACRLETAALICKDLAGRSQLVGLQVRRGGGGTAAWGCGWYLPCRQGGEFRLLWGGSLKVAVHLCGRVPECWPRAH